MSQLNIFGETLWGSIQSTHTDYDTARGTGGTKTVLSTASGYGPVGQQFIDPNYFCYEQFMRFECSVIPADEYIVSGAFRFCPADSSTGVSWNLEIRDHNWGDVLNTSDWVAGVTLDNSDRIATVENFNACPVNRFAETGSNELRDILDNRTSLRVLLNGSRHRLGNTPETTPQVRSIYGPDSGFDGDPSIAVYTVVRSTLAHVGGAMAQLADGTHVYLQTDAQASPTITLRHRDHSNAVTTIATLSTGTTGGSNFRPAPAFQAITLVVDEDDNIYVIGNQASLFSGVIAKCWAKTNPSTYTWTARSSLSGSVGGYAPGRLNNFSAAYHHASFGRRIQVACAHTPGTGAATQWSVVTLDAEALLTGSGDLITSTQALPTWMSLHTTGTFGYVVFPNETGTCLDVCGEVGGSRGAIVTADGNGTVNVGKYDLDGPEEPHPGLTTLGSDNKDGNTKYRALPIPGRGYATFVNGLMTLRTWPGVLLGTCNVVDAAIAGVPTFNEFNASTTWDVIYDTAGQKVWLYYIDTADAQSLKRIGISLTSFILDAAPVEVSAAVGDVGTSNLAIRLPRGRVDERSILIHVANLDGSTHSTLSILDSLNVAPNAPVQIVRSNFDARVDATFDWVFSDPNLFDTQSAFEIEIVDVSDASLDHDTGKTVGTDTAYILAAETLDNGKTYQWRVRTWDRDDEVSPWSNYQQFDTDEQGEVEITDPAIDNVGGIVASEYPVTWSFSAVGGAIQEQRRVKVVRTGDSATISDTGFQTTASPTHTVTNLESDVEYRIEVTVIDTDDLTSNTAERLITPSYVLPEIPVFSVALGDIYVELQIANPEATGDKPVTLRNLVYRRSAGGEPDLLAGEDGRWVQIGVTDINSTFRDYTCAAGVVYEYAIAAEA